MNSEIENPVLVRASRPVRARNEEMEKRDSLLEKMLRTTHIPRLPQIREADPDFWYTVEIDEGVYDQIGSYVANLANSLWRGEPIKSYSLTEKSGHVITDFHRLALQGITARYVENDTTSRGLFHLFALSLGKALKDALSKRIKGERGILSSVFTSEAKVNNKLYIASRELQTIHKRFIKNELHKLYELNPTATRRAFGDKGSRDVDDSIASLLFGGLKPDTNGRNPWIFFDFDPADFNAEKYGAILEEQYGTIDVNGKKVPLLSVNRINEIERVLANQAKREKPELQKQGAKRKEIQRYILNEGNARRMLYRPWPYHELLKQAVERKGSFSDLTKKSSSEGERLYTLEKVLEAYETFMGDLHTYEQLRQLQSKINLVPTNFAQITVDGPINPNSFAFAPNRSPILHGLSEVVINIDTIGYTNVATDKSVSLSAKELHERQSNSVLGEIQKAANELGLNLVFKEGDAIILSGQSVQDVLYFAHHVKTKLAQSIQKKLATQSSGNTERLEEVLMVLEERQYDPATYSDRNMSSRISQEKDYIQRALRSEKERMERLNRHPLDFRISLAEGELYHEEDEYGKPDVSGQAIAESARLMTHVKGAENVPYDVSIMEGKLDNQSGCVVSGSIVEKLERHVKEHAPHTIQHHYGIQMPDGTTADLVVHREEDGTEIVYRSLSQDEIQFSKEFKGRIWKIVTNEEEKKRYQSTINGDKTDSGLTISSPPSGLEMDLGFGSPPQIDDSLKL